MFKLSTIKYLDNGVKNIKSCTISNERTPIVNLLFENIFLLRTDFFKFRHEKAKSNSFNTRYINISEPAIFASYDLAQ